MANLTAAVEPLVSGAALKGAAKAATFTTDGFSLPVSGRRVGVWLDLTVTGTSPTLDIDVEFTGDGTTYGTFPQAADTGTEAEIAQITATGASFYWFENAVPFGEDSANYKLRLECTIGGTSPSFTFNEVKVFCW